MAQTLRRQPFTVSTNSNDYPKSQFFNQTQFKGLCTNQNDVSIDPSTFSDAQNMYVDENGVLTSRPPLKIFDGEAFIVDQWTFGQYGLRLHRLLRKRIKNTDGEIALVKLDHALADTSDELYFVFSLRCITHNTASGQSETGDIYGEYLWAIPVSVLGWELVPKVSCAQIEDKIFIWFAGLDVIAFNTAGIKLSDGNNYLYFEDGVKYLYYPIHKLVINGIESDLETKNYLTETYRRRHQYSAFSTVNFEKLAGRQMSVNMSGAVVQDRLKHLYDITVQEHQDQMMLYPYSQIGNNYHIDIVQTVRSTVVLRYSLISHIIEISFDGKFFRPLPPIEDILGMPLLTRDGLWVVAFTGKGVAKCKIVAQESEDFADEFSLSWVVEPYMHRALSNGHPCYLNTIDSSFIPAGYFETIDQFAYVFRGPSVLPELSGNIPYIYTEWLNGSNDKIWGFTTMYGTGDGGSPVFPLIVNDDIKVHFRYTAPTIDGIETNAVVSIMTPSMNGHDENGIYAKFHGCILTYFFKQDEDSIGRTLRDGDAFRLMETHANPTKGTVRGYFYRLEDGRFPSNNGGVIQSNDVVLRTTHPIDISDTDNYDADKNYAKDDFCVYNGFIYQALQDTKGNTPETEYWKALKNPYNPSVQMAQYPETYFIPLPDGTQGPSTHFVYLSWKYIFLFAQNSRTRLKRIDGKSGDISSGDHIEIDFLGKPALAIYTPDELNDIFGPIKIYNIDGTVFKEAASWAEVFPGGRVWRAGPSDSYTGYINILGLDNPAVEDRFRYFYNSKFTYKDKDNKLHICEPVGYGYPCAQMDSCVLTPILEGERLLYTIVAGYSLLCKFSDSDEYKRFDCIINYKYDYVNDKARFDVVMRIPDGNSQWFRIMPNSDTILTDMYLYQNGEFIARPQNGELSPTIDDPERRVMSNDTLVLALQTSGEPVTNSGNLHKLNYRANTDEIHYDNGTELVSGLIKSGDLVSYVFGAETERDYLTPSGIEFKDDIYVAEQGHRFYIERLAVNAEGVFVTAPGEIKQNELIRLRAYDEEIHLPADNIGNPLFVTTLVIEPWEYPEAPAGWVLGDPWPTSFPAHLPIFANADGSIRSWAPGDPLPTGPVLIYGVSNILNRVKPISINSNGTWYLIDGALWTSQVSTDVTLELDEYVNGEIHEVFDDNGVLIKRIHTVSLNPNVPDAHAVANEHYLSYVDNGKNLLEVTAARRDENKLFSDEGTDLLLYLPKRNEQYFANTITALHPLSDTEMGVFTDKDVWYITTTALNDDNIAYTKPIKSKIPVGLRQGSEVITALDGQALIFPTPRGLVGLAPQDFVATTEKTLTYLTDAIQEEYHKFYNDLVMSTTLIPNEFETGYKPFIHLRTYKHWILMYKYFDRTIFALDTRIGAWWKWTTPYPIKSITVGSRLHILLQLDFSPIDEYAMSLPAKKQSLLGVSFIWADQEVDEIDYCDDTVPGALNGLSDAVYIPELDDYTRRLHYASPIIDWHFTSQRLHFDQINYYKAIKGINLNLKGDETINAKMSTRVFRNLYHPEQSDVVQIKINDLRTFVKRFNLIHVIDFQYKIEHDADAVAKYQHQFKLNSLSIKYEVKERVR